MDAELPAESRGLLSNLVPPRRLGLILLGLRQARGDTLEEASARTGGLIDCDRLLSLETGEMFASHQELDVLAECYAFELADLVPRRVQLTLDYDERLIDAGGFAAVVPEGTTLIQVLQRYLVLVWALRGRQPGSYLQLRELDLEVLGESLDVGTASVIGILGELLDEQAWVDPYRHPAQFGRPRFGTIVPEAGILLCTGAGGALVFQSDPDEAEMLLPEEAALDYEILDDSLELRWMQSSDITEPPDPDTALPPPSAFVEPATAPELVIELEPEVEPDPAVADLDEALAPAVPVEAPPARSSWLRRRNKKPSAPTAEIEPDPEPELPVETPDIRNSAVSLPYFEEDPPAQPLPWDSRNYESKRRKR